MTRWVVELRLGRGYPVSRIVTPPKVARPPVHDNSAQSSQQTTLANNTAFTWGHTVATGADFAIVEVTGGINATTSDLTVPATVSLGGVALTEVTGGRFANDTTSSSFIRVFAGFGIPSGGQTASVLFNQGGTTFSVVAHSYTYSNVTSIGTMQTSVGSSGSASLSVPTSTANLVWGSVLRATTSVAFSSFTLTQRQTATSGTVMTFITGDIAPTSTSQSVAVSFSSSGAWVAVGLDLIGSN